MTRLASLLALLAVSLSPAALAASAPLAPLAVKGDDFVAPDGHAVRFWGVNMPAVYPDHTRADAMAANLAGLGVNLVRPHHNLRRSLDWNPDMVSGSLLSYKGNSREFEPVALDRFDYLNAALARDGIYISLSVHGTRSYLPGDADILKTDPADHDAWAAALTELNSWNWKKSFDVKKLLPVIDERAALLNEEFIRNLLVHKNPYTGLTYAQSPQVLYMEVINEHSLEYAIICQNHMPDYWQGRLQARWTAYAAAAGIKAGDLYKPSSQAEKALRAKFLNGLDEAYFNRIRAVVRATGSRAAMTYSNLWHGDTNLEMHSREADVMENHGYIDPLVVDGADDGFAQIGRSALAGKPFFIGELNESEGNAKIARQAPYRTMLPLAAAAYSAFNNWTGVVWFAWLHGQEVSTGEDGWARNERRTASIGGMLSDGMMIDHLRTTSRIFRLGLVAPSREPVTLWTDAPFASGDYNGLMRGKYNCQPGWTDVHEIRRAYGAVPAAQPDAPWMTAPAPSPIVSDTGQIVKDVARRQFTVAAPQAEGFSGFLDDHAPAGLKHLGLDGAVFATVVAVTDDGKAFGQSGHLIVSRTGLDAQNKELDGPSITLRGLASAPEGKHWQFTITRPRTEAGKVVPLTAAADGRLALPSGLWHEGELTLGGR